MKQCWLVNPRSGGGEAARIAQAVRGHADVIELDFSRFEAQLQTLSPYERVVIVGGDGTFSFVVTSDAFPDIPAAFLPTGTANDLARDLGTFREFRGLSPLEIVARIGALKERSLATWDCVVDGIVLPFCNYVSLGFEGAIVSDFHRWRERSQSQSRLRNRCMYVMFSLRHLRLRLRGMSIAVDEGGMTLCPPTRGVLFTNVKSHMGCGFSTHVSDPCDEKLECAVVSSVIDYSRMVVSAIGVVRPQAPFSQGGTFHVTGVPPDTAIQVDGEARSRVRSGELSFRLRKFVRVLGGT